MFFLSFIMTDCTLHILEEEKSEFPTFDNLYFFIFFDGHDGLADFPIH